MEFDWSSWSPPTPAASAREIEEAFEDPFSLRLLPDPDGHYGQKDARYFLLGRSVSNLPLFAVFWTDGKRYRVVAARRMTPDEENFYDRKNAEML